MTRVFAHGPEDVLHLPAAVDPARWTDALPRPRVVMGGAGAAADWRWADPAAARWNDKRRVVAWREELSCALPGTRVVRDVAEIDLPGPWVAKAPFAAAGRRRVFDDAAGAVRLLREAGALVVEPWVERAADFGWAGRVGADGSVARVSVHALLVDGRGRVRGMRWPAGLRDGEAARLEAAARAIGARLSAEGYRGAFGLDAWRAADGTFQPLGEVNARWTFGAVGRAILDRLGRADGRILRVRASEPGDVVLLDGAFVVRA